MVVLLFFLTLCINRETESVVVSDDMCIINVYQCNDPLLYCMCRKYQSNKCVSVTDLHAVSHSKEIGIDYTF